MATRQHLYKLKEFTPNYQSSKNPSKPLPKLIRPLPEYQRLRDAILAQREHIVQLTETVRLMEGWVRMQDRRRFQELRVMERQLNIRKQLRETTYNCDKEPSSFINTSTPYGQHPEWKYEIHDQLNDMINLEEIPLPADPIESRNATQELNQLIATTQDSQLIVKQEPMIEELDRQSEQSHSSHFYAMLSTYSSLEIRPYDGNPNIDLIACLEQFENAFDIHKHSLSNDPNRRKEAKGHHLCAKFANEQKAVLLWKSKTTHLMNSTLNI